MAPPRTMLLHLLLLVLPVVAQSPRRPAPRPAVSAPARPTPAPVFFTSPYTLDEMRNKQAVVETTAGTFVMQLLPESAPNHVGLFMKLAADGAYTGTIFHRVIRYGIIQGGDPISVDPARTADYGSGGFNQVRAEPRAGHTTAGAVAAALLQGEPDSAGAEFFICATDQPGLDGQYTVFARVVEGLEVVQTISAVEADAEGRPRARVAITGVTIRDTPVDPFAAATAADLAAWRATVETSMGAIDLELLPDKAPETVRAFLQMAAAGVYDGIRIHRVAANFVVQTGALAYRDVPLTASQQRWVHDLPPEFTDTPNVSGTVSMAHGDDPGSGSTSFFICIGECRALDGKYTVFARVAGGTDVLQAIAAVPVDVEAPRTPIVVTRIRASKTP
jgi:peptidyl-prolyl cis-trans isomerase B (cyclophilin B)